MGRAPLCLEESSAALGQLPISPPAWDEFTLQLTLQQAVQPASSFVQEAMELLLLVSKITPIATFPPSLLTSDVYGSLQHKLLMLLTLVFPAPML